MEKGFKKPKIFEKSGFQRKIEENNSNYENDIDYIKVKKDSFLNPPNKTASKEKFKKTTSLTKKIRESLEIFLPNIFKNWMLKRKIISEIPSNTLKEAIFHLDRNQLPEIMFISDNDERIILNIHVIKSIIPSIKGKKLEDIITAIDSSKHPLFKESLLGSLNDIYQISPEEIIQLKPKKIHIALILLHKRPEKFIRLVRILPPAIIRKILPEVSEDLFWEILKNLTIKQIPLISSFLTPFSIERIVSEEFSEKNLKALIPYMQSEDIELLIDQVSHKEKKLTSVEKILDCMKAEQIAGVLIHMSIQERKTLLKEFWKKPMGITMAIANGKMQNYQIAAAIIHPHLVIDVLNSVEWMNHYQIEITEAILNLIIEEIKKIAAGNYKKYIYNNEQLFLIDSTLEIKKLKNQKYHMFYKKIKTISDLTNKIPNYRSISHFADISS